MDSTCKEEENETAENEISIESEETCRKCRIRRDYVPLKMIYFFFFAGESCALPYRPLFLKHLGMSTKQTGIVWTIERVIAFILPPFLGAITDKSRRPKLVLIILLLVGSFIIFSMYFIPQEQDMNFVGNNSRTGEESLQSNQSTCFNLNCRTSTELNSSVCVIVSQIDWDQLCRSETTYSRINSFQCIHLLDVQQSNITLLPLDSMTSYNNSNVIYDEKCELVSNDNSITIQSSEKYVRMITSIVTSNNHVLSDKHNKRLCIVFDPEYSESGVPKCDVQSSEFDEYGVTFWLVLILVILSTFSTTGIGPVIEATVFGVLGTKNRHKFGNQRLWASVGYGSAALLIGYFKDRTAEAAEGQSSTSIVFLPMFVGVIVCWSCASVVAAKLPVRTAKERGKVNLRDIKYVLKKPKALAFLGLVLFYGSDNAVQEIYLFWLAESKLNAPSAILGATTFVGSMLDIPFCLASGRLIRRFGHGSIICFGMISFSTRLFLCTVVTEPWQLLLVESLRGITWGLTWVVICAYTAKISPPGLETLMMGVTQACLWGLGYSAGALTGGVLYQTMGGDGMFRLMATLSMIATILFGIFTLITRRKKPEDKNVEEEVNFDCDDSIAGESKQEQSIEENDVTDTLAGFETTT